MSICIEAAQIRWVVTSLLALIFLSSPAWAGSIVAVDGAFHVPITSWREARYYRVIAQQYDFSCGSAAVATLLTYGYGLRTDEEAAFRRMYERGDTTTIQKVGFSLLDMRQYLAAQGYDADGFKADLNSVIKIGVPVITLITTGTYHHFVVLRGVIGDRVLIADPSRGLRTVSRGDFEKMWTGVLLIVKNHADIGRSHFNEVLDWKLVPNAPVARGIDQQRRSLGDIFLNLPLADEF